MSLLYAPMRTPPRLSLLALLLLGSSCVSYAAPQLASAPPCDDGDYDGDRERVCETRTFTLEPRDLTLDASVNGGVRVEAWDRDAIEVEATVQAAAPTRAEARRLLDATRVETRGTVRAVSPDTDGRDAWVATSFVVRVPRETGLDLEALNGGIAVEGVAGRIRARTVNGGVALREVAGDVHARTTNGGISIALAGDAWEGAGLDVETTNGGISIALPDGYSADLTASTQTGRIAAAGLEARGARHERGQHVGESVEGRIGRGGAPIRAVTTNGGVSIRRSR